MPTSAIKRKTRLTAVQKKDWKEKGYLILRSFFSRDEVEAVNSLVDRRIENPETFGEATVVDVLAGPHVGKGFRATEAPREVFQVPIKINDLFLDEAEVRHLALNEGLTGILSQLLGGAPLICNSLSFLWGSQQPDHFDSWYMPPPSRYESALSKLQPLAIGPAAALVSRSFEFLMSRELPAGDRLAVSSICLEDVHPDAGPLTYYPGSHKIPPYRFSHGGIHAVSGEMPACRAYVERQIQQAGLTREEFPGKAGDVFLWHGQLLHGGSPIHEPTRTRKTLVTHYWRARDVPKERRVRVHETGFYQKREHRKV